MNRQRAKFSIGSNIAVANCNYDIKFQLWIWYVWYNYEKHFGDDTIECIFVHEDCFIWIRISFKFVLDDLADKAPAMGRIMAWLLTGAKRLFEPMMSLTNMNLKIISDFVDIQIGASFEYLVLKTVLNECCFIWNKWPINIWNDREAQK